MSNRRRLRADRILPSRLSPALKIMLIIFLVLAGFMIANTLYLLLNRLADTLNWRLFATSAISLPKLFQLMLLSHTAIGLLLAVIMVGFAVAHLSRVWRRRHRGSLISGILFVCCGLALSLSGFFILTAAASRDNNFAWWIHVICALLVVSGYILHRLVSYVRPPVKSFARYGVVTAGLVIILIIAHSFTHLDVVRTAEAKAAYEKGSNKGPGAKNRTVSKFTDRNFIPEGFVPPASPFFPSAATTTTGGYLPSRIITHDSLLSQQIIDKEISENGFVQEALIGAETCNRCHQDIVAQWAASAHRFASFNNPFYEATVQDMRSNAVEPNAWVEAHIRHYPETKNQIGKIKSKWCSGCHDPALMLAGKMDREIDRSWLESQAGLTCLACHAIDQIHDQTGNANYNIADEQEDPYLYANAENNTLGAFLHDAALKARPAVHKRQMLKPFFRTSEFCATCHKVSLREPVNNYRWLRGQDEYDNWHDSGVSLNASRTFYLPPQKRVCQDCHMPLEEAVRGDVAAKNGFVRSHRFLAVNTALPFLRGDQETIKRIEDFLREEKLRVDIFALKSETMSQPVMDLDHNATLLRTGERIVVDVVVRNRGVGHTFPGGTNDSNEGWLEFSIRDEAGNILAMSGNIDENGHLDPMAHTFKALILDKNGNPIHKRNAQDIHVTVFANVIGPGTADIAHYEFTVPSEFAGKILSVRARLLWRKFDRNYTEFAFNANPDGFKKFPHIPDLPITEIASDQVQLRIVPAEEETSAKPFSTKIPEWIRYNDYGIGLLLSSAAT